MISRDCSARSCVQGVGKLSHSGFHFFDALMEFYKAGLTSVADRNKFASSVEVACHAVRPDAVTRLQTGADWSSKFPNYASSQQFDEQAMLQVAHTRFE